MPSSNTDPPEPPPQEGQNPRADVSSLAAGAFLVIETGQIINILRTGDQADIDPAAGHIFPHPAAAMFIFFVAEITCAGFFHLITVTGVVYRN